MAIWDDVIPQTDKEIYQRSGYDGKMVGFGHNPALLIIDVTYDFVGNEPEPVMKSQERYPYSCGDNGWKAVHHIASLLPLVWEKQIPIFYSVADKSVPVKWVQRNSKLELTGKNKVGNDIVKEIAPGPKDIVIRKLGPSIFHNTPLINVLTPLKIDTLFVCGGVTSGCVRGTVVDGASYGFYMGVIEECCFDRADISHKVSLFEMNAKYADVISLAEAKEYFRRLPSKG